MTLNRNIDNFFAETEQVVKVDIELATAIAQNIGATPPIGEGTAVTKTSKAVSMINTVKAAATRKVAVLICDGFDDKEVIDIDSLHGLNQNGVIYEVVSEMQGVVKGKNGQELMVDHTFSTTDPVLYDAIYVIGGQHISSVFQKMATYYLKEAFKHYKPIGAIQSGTSLLEENNMSDSLGVVYGSGASFTTDFTQAISQHRFYDRKVM